MWYGESVWPTLVALGTVAAVSVLMWWDRRKPLLLIPAVLCLPAAVGAVYLERRIVTPREEVTARLTRIVADFEAGDAPAVLDAISSRAAELQELARRAISKVTISNVRLSDVNVELSGEDVMRARSHFRVTADIRIGGLSPPISRQPSRWKATWEQEADQKWRILELEQLDPLTGEPANEARRLVD
jgi:hypothetical protein